MAFIVCEHVMNVRRRTRGAKATTLCSNARSNGLPDTVLKIQTGVTQLDYPAKRKATLAH